jgi:hypothetical protein
LAAGSSVVEVDVGVAGVVMVVLVALVMGLAASTAGLQPVRAAASVAATTMVRVEVRVFMGWPPSRCVPA